MTREQIIETIKGLALSQGFYGRLLKSWEELEENDPDRYDALMTLLEKKNFSDPLDLVLFIEM